MVLYEIYREIFKVRKTFDPLLYVTAIFDVIYRFEIHVFRMTRLKL